MVDMYPTLAGLGGASLSKSKPLDGLDVWPAIGKGNPSPRDEVVYNIEGSWRLCARETGSWCDKYPPDARCACCATARRNEAAEELTVTKFAGGVRESHYSKRPGLPFLQPILHQRAIYKLPRSTLDFLRRNRSDRHTSVLNTIL